LNECFEFLKINFTHGIKNSSEGDMSEIRLLGRSPRDLLR